MDLSVAMIKIRYELNERIKELRQAIPVPPYIISAVLSEIQNDLKGEEKELLTVMLVQAENKVVSKEEENAEDGVLHDDRESGEE